MRPTPAINTDSTVHRVTDKIGTFRECRRKGKNGYRTTNKKLSKLIRDLAL